MAKNNKKILLDRTLEMEIGLLLDSDLQHCLEKKNLIPHNTYVGDLVNVCYDWLEKASDQEKIEILRELNYDI